MLPLLIRLWAKIITGVPKWVVNSGFAQRRVRKQLTKQPTPPLSLIQPLQP